MSGLLSLPAAPWVDLSPLARQELLVVFSAAVFAWTLLFLLLRFVAFPNRSHDFNNRLVSECHVAVALALSTYAIDWADPLGTLGGPNTSAQVLTMLVSEAYFVYDMFCCLAHPSTSDVATTIHHVATVLGFAFGVYCGKSGTELCCCLWLMELSNPFMHARELFKEAKVSNPTLLTLNDVMFVVVFTVSRIILGPVGTYKTATGVSATGVKVGAVMLQLVNFLWFYKIMRFAYFKFIKKSKKKAQ